MLSYCKSLIYCIIHCLFDSSFIPFVGYKHGNTVATPRPHGKWQAYCKLKSPASQDSLCRQWLCHKPATGQGRIETTARCRLPPFCLDWSRQIEINFQSNCSPGLIFKQVIRAGGEPGTSGRTRLIQSHNLTLIEAKNRKLLSDDKNLLRIDSIPFKM